MLVDSLLDLVLTPFKKGTNKKQFQLAFGALYPRSAGEDPWG